MRLTGRGERGKRAGAETRAAAETRNESAVPNRLAVGQNQRARAAELSDKLFEMRVPALILLVMTVAGCPERNHEQGRSSLPPCRKFGDSCEFAPGKLGSCVMRDGCTSGGGECFTCQSQH